MTPTIRELARNDDRELLTLDLDLTSWGKIEYRHTKRDSLDTEYNMPISPPLGTITSAIKVIGDQDIVRRNGSPTSYIT